MKFVDSVHILSGTSIPPDHLEHANRLLLSFVDEFEEFYGERNMVFNVHQLRHLADCVKLNGPLFTFSNYCMEDNIGHIVSLVKGTTDVSNQICSKYLLEKKLFIHLEQSERAREFYNRIQSTLSYAVAEKINNNLVIGKPLINTSLGTNELTFISEFLQIRELGRISEYKSVLLDSKIFYETVANSLGKRTNDSFIYNVQSQHYAEIKSIFVIDERLYFLVNEKFRPIYDLCTVKYIKLFREIDNFEQKIIQGDSIGQKHALIKFENTIACAPFPNFYERN